MQDAALVAVATGMRAGELFSLSPAQVDLTQATVHITHGRRSPSARAVPLNQDALPVLERRLEKAQRLVFTRDIGTEVEGKLAHPDGVKGIGRLGNYRNGAEVRPPGAEPSRGARADGQFLVKLVGEKRNAAPGSGV